MSPMWHEREITNEDAARRVVMPMRDCPSWELQNVVVPTLLFGEPHIWVSDRTDYLGPGRPSRWAMVGGEFTLFIQGYWSLRFHGKTVATTSTYPTRQSQLLHKYLLGQRIVSIETRQPSGYATLTFDLGAVVEVRPKPYDDTLWRISTKSDDRQFSSSNDGVIKEGWWDGPEGPVHPRAHRMIKRGRLSKS